MEADHYLDDDFFIPDNYHLFRIKQTTLGPIPIPSRTLPYASINATIKDLLQIFLEAYNIKSGKVEGKKIVLGMQGVDKQPLQLPLKMQVLELKSKLNNFSAKMLEFQPYLTDQSALYNERASEPNLSSNPQYKLAEDGHGKIQVCIQLPQIDKHINYEMTAKSNLQTEVNLALKKNEQTLGKNFSNMKYKAICPVCQKQEKMDAKVYTLFHTHQVIEIIFEKFEQERPSQQQTSIQLEIMQGTENSIKTVPYSSVTLKRVRNVLQECGLDNAQQLSLRVMGVVLRPGDLLSRVEKQAKVMGKGRVPAMILEESELFYTMGVHLLQKGFNLQEVATRFSREQALKQIYLKRQKRISEISELQKFRFKGQTRQLRESNFLDPILCYTSKHFYEQLNKFLRDNDFANNSQTNKDRIEYKFSFSLVRSLLMLSGYVGLTYRGASFLDIMAEKGKIVCYKSFFSSSKKPKKAASFGMRTYYTIKSLTGRQISKFSYFDSEVQVLFMPYSYFHVTEIQKTQYGIAVTLEEIPIPRRIDSNLLVWVDDDPTQGSKIMQDLQLSHPKLTTQFIQLTSNDHLQAWLKKFGRWAQERSKVSLITDLRRMEVLDAGLETIRKIRSSLGNKVNTYIYTFNLPLALNLLEKSNLKLSDTLSIGKHPKEVKQFITEKALVKQELQEETCQLI